VSKDQTPKGVPIGRMRVKELGKHEEAPIAAPPPPPLPPPPKAPTSLPPEVEERLFVELGKIHSRLDVLEPVAKVSRGFGTVKGKILTAGAALALAGAVSTSIGMVWRAATRVEIQAAAIESQQKKAERLVEDAKDKDKELRFISAKIGELGGKLDEFQTAQAKREEGAERRIERLENVAMRATTAATRAERAAGEAAAAARPLRRPR
jgi:hypothetical protein